MLDIKLYGKEQTFSKHSEKMPLGWKAFVVSVQHGKVWGFCINNLERERESCLNLLCALQYLKIIL